MDKSKIQELQKLTNDLQNHLQYYEQIKKEEEEKFNALQKCKHCKEWSEGTSCAGRTYTLCEECYKYKRCFENFTDAKQLLRSEGGHLKKCINKLNSYIKFIY